MTYDQLCPYFVNGMPRQDICVHYFLYQLNQFMHGHQTLVIALLTVFIVGGVIGLLYEWFFGQHKHRVFFVGVSGNRGAEYLEAAQAIGEFLRNNLYVKFEQFVITDSHLYFKVAIARRRWDGAYISLLPEDKTVAYLSSKDMCKELSSRINRRLEAHASLRSGLWYSVHYNEDEQEGYKPYLDIRPDEPPI